MKIRIILLLFAVFAISCKTNKIVAETSHPQVVVMPEVKSLKGKWVLEYLLPVNGKDAKDLFKIQMPYLNFIDENKVAGNNGCNNVSGGYSISSDYSIQFDTDKFGSTRMFCENFDEKVFLNELKKVNRFDVVEEETKLLLMTDDIVSMSFVKAEN